MPHFHLFSNKYVLFCCDLLYLSYIIFLICHFAVLIKNLWEKNLNLLSLFIINHVLRVLLIICNFAYDLYLVYILG